MKLNNKIKLPQAGRLCVLALASCSALLLCGCLRKELKEAKINGEIVTDTKGRRWLLKHNIGDTFFLSSVNADGTINNP